jgi:hypothetical protein
MLTWLFEGPTVLYFVLGIAAVSAGLRWWVSRGSPAVIAFAVVAGLIPEFVLDPDGQWRWRGLEVYPAQVDPMSGQSIYIPIAR